MQSRHWRQYTLSNFAFASLSAIICVAGCDRSPAVNPEGDAPKATPVAWFNSVAAERGLVCTSNSGHVDRYWFPEMAVGGGALFDMDGDGNLDAYIVTAGGLFDPPEKRPGNRLFRNLGDGRFEDATEGSGADDHGYGMGVATGDYDNDGDLDLYITNLGPNVLLRNDGNGRFTDVTSEARVADPSWSTCAAFLDYDADGDLDLFVSNYVRWTAQTEVECFGPAGQPDYCSPKNYRAPAPDTLYRNDGNGVFTEVSREAGLDRAFGNGFGVLCGDFTGDGRIDIFVANDGTVNQLWINQGDGRFIDEAISRGCAMDQAGGAKAGMGVAAGDLDDDGDLDLLVVNLRNETDSLYLNSGDYFEDRTAAAGIAAHSRPFTRFGTAFIDFDLDGRLDLYEANGRVTRGNPLFGDNPYAEPNLLFRGSADGRFVEVEPRGGTASLLFGDSRAAAFGDIDDDGGVDILVVNRDEPAHLLHNVVPNRGHWIMFRVLEQHGRDAIGATLSIRVGDRTLTRDVRTGYSYCAANDSRVHIGLGGATHVDEVRVRWPTGETESFESFPADQITTLRFGEGKKATSKGR